MPQSLAGFDAIFAFHRVKHGRCPTVVMEKPRLVPGRLGESPSKISTRLSANRIIIQNIIRYVDPITFDTAANGQQIIHENFGKSNDWSPIRQWMMIIHAAFMRRSRKENNWNKLKDLSTTTTIMVTTGVEPQIEESFDRRKHQRVDWEDLWMPGQFPMNSTLLTGLCVFRVIYDVSHEIVDGNCARNELIQRNRSLCDDWKCRVVSLEAEQRQNDWHQRVTVGGAGARRIRLIWRRNM